MDDSELAVLREETTELGQVVAVLAAAGYDPALIPVGEGDRLLLRLHRELAGHDIELALACPDCTTVNAVRLGPDTVPPAWPRSAVSGRHGGLRQPTYADLTALARLGDDATAGAELLRRCAVGTPARPPTEADFELIDDTLAGPLAFACAGCGAEVEEPIDLQSLVLRALLRLLDELDTDVHLLASAYGWELPAIERLPRMRRRRLAELASGGAAAAIGAGGRP